MFLLIEHLNLKEQTTSECATMLLLGFGLIRLERILRRKPSS
jgi:hypothetical protein